MAVFIDVTQITWIQVIVGVFIGMTIFIFGYHSGNRFRISRLHIRDPKEIKKRITHIQNCIEEAQEQIDKEAAKIVKNEAFLSSRRHNIKIWRSQLTELEWVMDNDIYN